MFTLQLSRASSDARRKGAIVVKQISSAVQQRRDNRLKAMSDKRGWLWNLYRIISGEVDSKGTLIWRDYVEDGNGKKIKCISFGLKFVEMFGFGKMFKMSDVKSTRHQLTQLSFRQVRPPQDTTELGESTCLYTMQGLYQGVKWEPFVEIVKASCLAKWSRPQSGAYGTALAKSVRSLTSGVSPLLGPLCGLP